jgi:uncharacterized protein (DUF302 family)
LPAAILFTLFFLPGCVSPAPGDGRGADIGVYERSTPKPVADAVEDVEFAVTERNFRITGRLHVGQAIRARDGTPFPDYEVLLFCNLALARQMLDLDPVYINYCPGRVTVRGADGTTRISAPLLPEPADRSTALADLVRRVNAQLREIVDYGTQAWATPTP